MILVWSLHNVSSVTDKILHHLPHSCFIFSTIKQILSVVASARKSFIDTICHIISLQPLRASPAWQLVGGTAHPQLALQPLGKDFLGGTTLTFDCSSVFNHLGGNLNNEYGPLLECKAPCWKMFCSLLLASPFFAEGFFLCCTSTFFEPQNR